MYVLSYCGLITSLKARRRGAICLLGVGNGERRGARDEGEAAISAHDPTYLPKVGIRVKGAL